MKKNVNIYRLTSYVLTVLFFVGIKCGYSQEMPAKTIDTTEISPLFMPVYYAPTSTRYTNVLQYRPVDTLDIVTVHFSNRQRYTENIYQSLGVVGQAHKSMVYDLRPQHSFSLIDMPYPLLFKQQEDLCFYKLKSVYTKLAYNLGFLLENELHATHAQYVKGVTIVANLRGYINPGDYTNQSSSNQNIDALIHYELPKKWYGFRISYIFNRFANQENGGLKNYADTLEKLYQTRTNYPVHSDHGYSKTASSDLLLQQYVNLQGKERYFGNIAYYFQFKHLKLDYQDYGIDSNYYSYVRRNSDTIFDTLATALKYYSFRNTIQWSSYRPFSEMSTKSYMLHLDAGLSHEYIYIYYSTIRFNTYTPYAKAHIRLFKAIDLYAQFSYSFNGYNANDVWSSACLEWSFNRQKRHFMGVSITYNRIAPDFIFSRNEGYLTYYDSIKNAFGQWDSLFPKQNLLKLSVYWNYKNYNMQLNYFMERDRVLWGDNMLPFVNSQNVSILQLHLYAPVRIKGFGLIGNFYLQYSTSRYVPLPIFAGKLSTFYLFRIFSNKLKMQIGMDMMYNTPYYANGYNPMLHQFYNQNRYTTGNYLYLDANVSLQVQRIAFYVRAGNLLSNVLGYKYLSTPNYPSKAIADLNISIGLSWRFYD